MMGTPVLKKGNMDVELTIDAIEQAGEYDIMILFSGDSDFQPLIKNLRRRGKKVYVFSSKRSVSRELRTCADGYTDILQICENIWKP
jgi:uncharacterized protein (TIGR00288 family)